MKTRNSRVIKFILEFSQVLLVFFGVFSAILCTANSLQLTYDRILLMAIMLMASVVFYGLFTVLETFRKGKLYGILAITLFFALIGFRFMAAMQKAIVTVVNSFLKEFMNYTGTTISLMSYTDTEGSSVKFCTNLLLILVGVYLIAIISAFFYRRRHSKVFLIVTGPFVILPLMVGKVGNFSDLFLYLIMAMTIVGTRHLRTDATDRRMRQKLSLILLVIGLICGGISYAFIPPAKYDNNLIKLTQVKNSLVALTSWTTEDVFTWLKANFNDDAISYGRIGTKKEISYTGETMLKISGDINSQHGLYLKGYVGDHYENNSWTSLASEEEYREELEKLDETGVTIDNWHTQLRNELGDNESSGQKDIWKTGELRIRNLAFGYGNYLVPYLPTSAFKCKENGRQTVDEPGIDYAMEYYLSYPAFVRQDILRHNYRLANEMFWESNKLERQQLKEFAVKHFLQVPESLRQECQKFEQYLQKRDSLLSQYRAGKADESQLIRAVKDYITKDTTYSLAPGKTPAGQDTVTYFLNEGKKGYCTYYATTAAVLLRSVGVPTRYVEGMYITKGQLEKGSEDGKEIEVPDEDAHAWIEVYNENYGFVPVEVTPGQGEDDLVNGQPNPENGTETPEPSESSEPEEDEPEDKMEVATPTPSVTETPEESMEFEDIDGNEEDSDEGSGKGAGEKKGNQVLWTILKVLSVLILFVAVMETQRRIRKRLFVRNMRSYKAKRRIRMAYHHLVPVFTARSVVYRGQSMAEYTAQIAEAMAMPEQDIAVFVALVYHARFGPDTIGEEELRLFGEMYYRITNKIYEDVTFIKRLYYMYIMVL